jgi:hypothetical protein
MTADSSAPPPFDQQVADGYLGERIENPDLLATWTIQEPPPKH